MTPREARSLKRGDRVIWNGQAHDAGTVTGCTQQAIGIAWDGFADQDATSEHLRDGRWAAITDIAQNISRA